MFFLRRLKLAYLVKNVLYKKNLSCNEDIYKKYGINKSVLSLLDSQDLPSTHDDQLPWMDRKVFSSSKLTESKTFETFATEIQIEIANWHKRGYMILPGFISHEDADEVNSEVTRLLEEKTAKQRLDERVIFAIHDSASIYRISTNRNLLQILSFVLGKEVKLFQSLNFLRGTAQLAHSDTIHMTTFPLGYLIAVWIALEDIDENSGPLFYYPGSHKLPYVLNNHYPHGGNYLLHGKNNYQKYEGAIQEVIESNKLDKEVFLAKKGDVFVWHANLLHGGSPILNKELTRKSMVLHFYTEDVICYHEITQRPAIFNGKEAECAVISSEV